MHRCDECGKEHKTAQGLGAHRAGHRRRASRTHKRCARCKESKTVDQFPISTRHGFDGLHPYCLACKAAGMREANKRYRERHPIDHARQNLRRAARRLGVSVEAIEAKLAAQGGKCAICGGGPTGNHSRLVIDHNHRTGAVRGLLCGWCNTALGHLRDDPAIVDAAAAYLRLHGHEGE